jgi:hypothetical protein
MDCLGADPTPQLYHDFKEHFIAGLPQDAGWQIDEAVIRQWLDSRKPSGIASDATFRPDQETL